MADELQIIRTFANDLDASIGQAVLDANGIAWVLLRDDGAGAMPWLNTLHPLRLAVDASDAALATRLLDGDDLDDLDAGDAAASASDA
jgi:hypothetical protein